MFLVGGATVGMVTASGPQGAQGPGAAAAASGEAEGPGEGRREPLHESGGPVQPSPARESGAALWPGRHPAGHRATQRPAWGLAGDPLPVAASQAGRF